MKENLLTDDRLEKRFSLRLQTIPWDSDAINYTADIWIISCALLCQQLYICVVYIPAQQHHAM